MGKRARRAALMGFVGGVLSDVKNRWETERAQAAEEAKEQRLLAIRQQERGEDRAFTREQFAAQQTAMDKRDERNYEQQTEFFEKQEGAASKRDERNFGQQRQLAAEARDASAAENAANRAHSEKLAGMRTPAEKSPRIQSFVGESSKRTVNLDMNNPRHVQALQDWQRKESVRPAAAVGQYEEPETEVGAGAAGARSPASPTMVYNPKTKRLEPVAR